MLNSTRPFVTGVSCALIGFALHGQTAFASLADDPPSIKVSYAELDLSKPAGAQELYRRIKRAAKAVCGSSFSTADLRRSLNQKKCYESAIDDAVSRVDRPVLSALHKEDTARFGSAG